jgi:hypothetical protein
MGARVAIFGRIATADVAAFEAHPQMYPGIADFQAIFATLGVRLYFLQVFSNVSAGCSHGIPPGMTLVMHFAARAVP